MNNAESSTTQNEVRGNGIYHGWVVVAAGFVLVLILYGAYYSFGVFKNPILDDLGWSDTAYSGAHAVYLVVHGILAIILGRFSDKYGPRWVVAFGVILIALGYGLISQINAPWQFYIYLGLLIGIGMGAAYVPPLVTVAKWFDARRGLALGVAAAGVGVGQIALPPLLKLLINEIGWRDSLLVMAAMTCVLGIAAALVLKNPPNPTNNEIEIPTRKAIKTQSFWFLLCVFACLVFGTNMIMQHLEPHVEDSGIGDIPSALVITIIGISGICGRILSGYTADKIGNKITAAICLGLQVIVFYWLFKADQLWAFYVIAMLYGLGYGGTLPLIVKMSSEFFGTMSGGTTFGVLLAGASIGGAAGVFSTGIIHDVTDEYLWAFFTAGTVIVVASIFNLILKPPANAQPDT